MRLRLLEWFAAICSAMGFNAVLLAAIFIHDPLASIAIMIAGIGLAVTTWCGVSIVQSIEASRREGS